MLTAASPFEISQELSFRSRFASVRSRANESRSIASPRLLHSATRSPRRNSPKLRRTQRLRPRPILSWADRKQLLDHVVAAVTVRNKVKLHPYCTLQPGQSPCG